jgi:4-amino-4-deoxy-L-arabinose transferase-like glycosyltransferase
MVKRFFPEILLAIASLLLLGGMLSGHAIWTQEYRWQQIALHMLSTNDYWHPYLEGRPYYDKPLMTYWFIVALAKLNYGVLTKTLLRLPSVFAGLITLACTYFLGKKFGDRKVALLATWFLLTTFYFVFFARVASADMWNVASILLCLVWFFYAGLSVARVFWRDLIFFLLLAFSALLKGLIGPVLIFLVLIPTLWRNQLWQRFFNFKSIAALMIAISFYLLPFFISSATSTNYQENGLVEVFRENILRFFEPFDHEGPWWTYFAYLPAYCAPWILLSLIFLMKRQKPSSENKNFLYGEGNFCWAVLSIFIFLSLSGSRRSYYILPIVPFVMLWFAQRWQQKFIGNVTANRVLVWFVGLFYLILCVNFLIIQPWYYLHHG